MTSDLEVSLGFLEFPEAHTCDGGNLSPQISLEGLDAGAVAIMVFNPSMRKGYSYSPWIIWDLPAKTVIPAGIPEGKVVTRPLPAVQGQNDAGHIGYAGPCPPPGGTHRYLFRVYGLDGLIGLSGGSTKYELTAAIHGHVVQYGETEAVCSR
jgi:hypothetical protein